MTITLSLAVTVKAIKGDCSRAPASASVWRYVGIEAGKEPGTTATVLSIGTKLSLWAEARARVGASACS